MSLFLKKADEYNRDLDVIRNYIESSATYMSKTQGVEYEKAYTRIKEAILDGTLPFENKPMLVNFRKQCRADKEVKKTTVSDFLRFVSKTRKILMPNMVVYENPKIERSFISEVILKGFTRRKKNKKISQEAKFSGDKQLAVIKNIEQGNNKIVINSSSGAASDRNNALNSESKHSALTSTCRIMASISNLLSEAIIGGHFVYYCKEDIINDIIARIRLSDLALVEKVCYAMGLVLPTTDYIMEKIESKNFAMVTKPELKEVRDLVDSLTSVERAAYVYTYNLYGFIELNRKAGQKFIEDFTFESVYEKAELIEADACRAEWSTADSYIESYITTCSPEETTGFSKGEIVGNDEKIVVLGSKLRRLRYLVLTYYAPFFKAFYIVDYTPPNVFDYRDAIRTEVTGGDTDSTFYCVQSLIELVYGKDYLFDHKTDKLRELVGYISSQTTCHNNAMLSEQMGVAKEDLFEQKMKPEYSMVVMGVTTRAKHYYAALTAQEGNLYSKPVMQTKGVGMRSSKIPRWLIDISEKYEAKLAEAVMSRRKLSVLEALSPIAYIEHSLCEVYRSGKPGAFQSYTIKTPDSYKAKEENPSFFYQRLWNEIFSPKYGPYGELPAQGIKINVDLPNKTALKTWIETFECKEMQERALAFFEREGRKSLVMISVPNTYLECGKVPEEIMAAMDLDRLIGTLMESFYYIAETMGFHYRNKKSSRFVFKEVPIEAVKNCMLFDVQSMFETSAIDLSELSEVSYSDDDDDCDYDESNDSDYSVD